MNLTHPVFIPLVNSKILNIKNFSLLVILLEEVAKLIGDMEISVELNFPGITYLEDNRAIFYIFAPVSMRMTRSSEFLAGHQFDILKTKYYSYQVLLLLYPKYPL